MKKIIVLFLLAAGTFSLSGCSLYGGTTARYTNTPVNQNPPVNTSVNQNPVSVPPADSTNTNVNTNTNQNPVSVHAPSAGAVNIQNFSFTPQTLTVKKGATVTWTNNDSAPHQIKSATFNSNLLSNGQSFYFTFNTAGSFDYSCAIHPSMTGKIIVE